MHKYCQCIDEKFVEPASGTWFDSFNPYTGEFWSNFAQGDAEDVERAVQAANSMIPGAERRSEK